MSKPASPSNFVTASFALLDNDYRAFSQAITAEMKQDPIGARQIAEVSLLKLGHETGTAGSPAHKMILKSVDVLSRVAPLIIFDSYERGLTLRALSVAEAICSWSSEIKAQDIIERTRVVVEDTSIPKALKAAIDAGVLRSSPQHPPALHL